MASIELTVAYPGREGAHSAAACDRLFPAARLVPLPTFSDVIDAVAAGRVPYGVLPIESSLVGPVAETHDLLYESPLSIVAEAIIPVNHCLVGPAAVELASIREIHSHPVALDQCRQLLASLPDALAVASPTTGDAASTVAAAGRSHRRRDRKRPGSQNQRADNHRRQRRRPPRGLHAVRVRRAVHAARPAGRPVADGLLVLDRSSSWRTVPRPRTAVPAWHRSQPAGLAPDPVTTVQLPVRRGAQRASARPGDLSDAEGDARTDRAIARLRVVPR